MKRIVYILSVCAISLSSCSELDLNPLSTGSNANWYEDESEVVMSLNDLYREAFWPKDSESYSDNFQSRSNTNEITNGTINSESSMVETRWKNAYKAIGRVNSLLANIDKAAKSIPEASLSKYIAEAKFIRASQYADLISHFGDVVYTEGVPDLAIASALSRTPKATVLKHIYADYDSAAMFLPTSYGSTETQRATKGAAYAMKARIALYMGDYAVARDAAQNCMDLKVYQLYPDFAKLFALTTKNSVESIFVIPRSVEFGSCLGKGGSPYLDNAGDWMTRNPGCYAGNNPSWELFCSFLCTDGLPIDESPLFNPREPFKNRDPRCTATIVEFQTRHLGYMYQPHPDSLKCYNFNTGKYVTNNDSRGVNQYASYDGIMFKKGIDDSWLTSGNKVDPDKIIVRYADVLLMYAEAKIELKEIDQTVLDAINKVRARAYGVTYTQTSAYPSVTTTDQTALRKILRTERRVELANEGLRYMDLIRWRLAEKALTKPSYGMLDPADLRTKIIKTGLWFFPEVPSIDEDGLPDFTSMYNKGLIKLLAIRSFDANKEYLWPIPSKDILINPNMTQNPGGY